MSLEFIEIARRQNGVVFTAGSRAASIDATGQARWSDITQLQAYLPDPSSTPWWPAGAPAAARVQVVSGPALGDTFDADFLRDDGVSVPLVLRREQAAELAQAMANSMEVSA